MDKLNYLKTYRQQFRDFMRVSRYYRQAPYEDKIIRTGEKIPFRHDWANLAQMHDLRVWTLAHAPQSINNLQRL